MTQLDVVDPMVPVPAAPEDRSSWGRRALLVARPWLYLAAGAMPVVGFFALAPDISPTSVLARYGLRSGELVAAMLGVAAIWWASRRGRTWDSDLVPAIIGLVAATPLLAALNGTPFAPVGIQGDQSFRTETLTRFADTWLNADFTYHGLPTYYAPAFFWVLGRGADILGIEPWRMLKVGTVLVALVVPLISYLLWRRLVPARTAALIAIVALVVQDHTEPYGWVVLAAIVPWWLEAVHGLVRPGLRPRHPITLGIIGALLFMCYYYYFFVGPIIFVLFILVQWWRGEPAWAQARRGLSTLGIAAAGSAVFWLPMLINFVTADDYLPYNNRFFRPSFGELVLPMTEPSLTGVICLLGLLFLLWTARQDALSRSLLIVLVALYVWHVIGFVAAITDMPLMSFKMRELTRVVLLTAGILAMVRLFHEARQRFRPADVRRVAAGIGMVLAIVVGDTYVTTVVDSDGVTLAHNETWPDGRQSPYASPDAEPTTPSAQRLRAVIDERFDGAGHPVVLSDRIDLFAFYPYYGFVQWNAHYSHPTAGFRGRVDLIDEMAVASSSREFADLARDNRFDAIDAIVLRVDGDNLLFSYKDNDYPRGIAIKRVSLPRSLVDQAFFDTIMVDDYLVAVRRA